MVMIFEIGKFPRRAAGATSILLGIFLTWMLSGCSPAGDDRLKAIRDAGELIVLTYHSPTTYYASPEGPAGFDYDLAQAFAENLGVELKLVVANSFADVLPRLAAGDADMAAAGLTITEGRKQFVDFGPPYQKIQQQVVYRLGTPRPTGVQELIGRQIEVRADTSYIDRLNKLKQDYPQLSWIEVDDKESDEILQLVWEGLVEITVADSHIFAVNRQFFPELQVAFDLHDPESLAWAFPKSEDNSLIVAAERFIANQRKNGFLAQLIERYYGPAHRSNFINLTVYRLRARNRLPLYQALFEAAGEKHDLDWRLLAAMGYQESYWEPQAVSPTGVRGIMMLTEDTANQLGVSDRLDPAQSIDGGARYLRHLIERMPDSITGPDRIWMALAAYNIGFKHVMNARALVRRRGGNPDVWNNVKEALPKLKLFASYARGRSRGLEPVIFVNRIRTYYDILVKLDEEEKARNRSEALKLHAPAI